MIYLDNAATTEPYESVMNTFQKVATNYYGNTASIHSYGTQSHNLLEDARTRVKALLQLENHELIFTSGATESNNIIIQSVLNRKKETGNTILVSEIEHPSVQNVIEKYKSTFKVETIKTKADGRIDLDDFKRKMNPDVIFVTVMAVNNIVGSVQPIEALAHILKKYPKAHFHVDATQAIGKVTIDYSFVTSVSLSAHKFNGLKGVGGLFIKNKSLVEPIIFGGEHEMNIRSGTVNLPAIISMARALRLTIEHQKEINERLQHYQHMIRDYISQYDNVKVHPYGVPHILNMSISGVKGEVIVNSYSHHEVMISTTSACASKRNKKNETLTAMGCSHTEIDGSVRISMGAFTRRKDIDEFLKVTHNVYQELKGVLHDG